MGGLKGAASGIKDKITGGGRRAGAGTPPARRTSRDRRRGRPAQGRLQPVDGVRCVPELHPKVERPTRRGGSRRPRGAQDLPESSGSGSPHVMTDSRRAHRVAARARRATRWAVTFHELSPSLTRIVLVIEYYPKGLFEKTGNMWRAQGPASVLRLRQFRSPRDDAHHAHADEVEGWRGRIEDSEVVETHEDAVEREEQEEQEEQDEYDESGTSDDEESARTDAREDESEDESEDEGDADDDSEDDGARSTTRTKLRRSRRRRSRGVAASRPARPNSPISVLRRKETS